MKILNTTKATLIAEDVIVAKTFFARLMGLLNRGSLKEREALVVTSCNCIHMFFMRFSIDAIFVSSKNHVVGLVEHLKPFHLSPIFWQASFTIELPAGRIKTSKTAIGDLIALEDR